jgi:hypothetical protein
LIIKNFWRCQILSGQFLIFNFKFLITKSLRQTKAERGGEVAAKKLGSQRGLRKVPPQYSSVPKISKQGITMVLPKKNFI